MWNKIGAPCLVIILAASTVVGQEAAQRNLSIEFEGNVSIPTSQLLDMADKCLAKYSHPPGGYDPHVLNFCLGRLRLPYLCRGYWRAVVSQLPARESDGAARIRVRVEEGARYRLGEVKIEGSRLYSPEQLFELLELKKGDVAGGAILEWLEQKVKRVYADKGYLQYSYDVEPSYRDAPDEGGEGVVDLAVTISEGRRFTVNSIRFAGNAGVPEQTLRQALRLTEGDVFSRSLYEESVRNLNRLGLFEEIDADKDVDFLTDDEGDQLEVVIRLKEKVKP